MFSFFSVIPAHQTFSAKSKSNLHRSSKAFKYLYQNNMEFNVKAAANPTVYLLDWDDTIINWTDAIRQDSLVNALDKFLAENPDKEIDLKERLDELRGAPNKRFREIKKRARQLARENGVDPGPNVVILEYIVENSSLTREQIDKIKSDLAPCYREGTASRVEPFEGALDFIDKIKRQGNIVEVVTNKPPYDFQLEYAVLKERFPQLEDLVPLANVFSTQDKSIRKPNPRMLLDAINAHTEVASLNVEAREGCIGKIHKDLPLDVIIVGDSIYSDAWAAVNLSKEYTVLVRVQLMMFNPKDKALSERLLDVETQLSKRNGSVQQVRSWKDLELLHDCQDVLSRVVGLSPAL